MSEVLKNTSAEHYAPTLAAHVHQELEILGALNPNWDGDGAKQIDGAIVDSAKRFVSQLPENIAPCPAVVPMAKGNLQFEWHKGSRTLELEFETPTTIHYLKWHPEEGVEDEDYFEVDDMARAVALIHWFVRDVPNV